MADILSRLKGLKFGAGSRYARRNPLASRMHRSYFAALEQLVRRARFETLLEVGCGEGVPLHMLSRSLIGSVAVGIDLSVDKLRVGSGNIPKIPLAAASVYGLPFEDDLFDLVLSSEVLAYLAEPDAALAEIARVGNEWFIFTVPNEPMWQLLNMAQGMHLDSWGKTPGHLQHWNSIELRGLLNSRFRIEKILKPIPWTLVLCRKA